MLGINRQHKKGGDPLVTMDGWLLPRLPRNKYFILPGGVWMLVARRPAWPAMSVEMDKKKCHQFLAPYSGGLVKQCTPFYQWNLHPVYLQQTQFNLMKWEIKGSLSGPAWTRHWTHYSGLILVLNTFDSIVLSVIQFLLLPQEGVVGGPPLPLSIWAYHNVIIF